MAERLCGKSYRLHPSGLHGPHHCLHRKSSETSPAELRSLLPTLTHASEPGEGHAGTKTGRATGEWPDRRVSRSRRPASPLRSPGSVAFISRSTVAYFVRSCAYSKASPNSTRCFHEPGPISRSEASLSRPRINHILERKEADAVFCRDR